MSQAKKKQYGLILPTSKKITSKKSNILVSRPSVFGDDSSSDEGSSKHKEVNAEIRNVARKKIIQKQTQIEIQKAMEQDATVYEYDSIYDEIKEQGKVKIPQSVSSADKQRKPKYIGNLLKAAENRVKERERIEERKIQKERENEGDEFKDKPEFVTSAYKRKMLERQEEIEKEKRMDAIEEALDVRKQRDLTGFYRHFLNQQMGEETTEVKKDDDPDVPNEDEDTSMSFSSSDEESNLEKNRKLKTSSQHNQQSQNHRKRYSTSESDSFSEKETLCSLSRSISPEKRTGRLKGSIERDLKNRTCDKDYSNRSRDVEKYSKYDRKSHRNHTRHKRSRSRSRSPRHRRKDDRRKDEKGHRPRKENRKEEEHKHKRSHRDESPSKKDTRDEVQQLNQSNDDYLKIKKHRSKESKEDMTLKHADEKQRDSSAMKVYEKHSDKSTILSARERYLARKATASSQPVVEADSE